MTTIKNFDKEKPFKINDLRFDKDPVIVYNNGMGAEMYLCHYTAGEGIW